MVERQSELSWTTSLPVSIECLASIQLMGRADYVLQKAISVARGEQRKTLIWRVRVHLNHVRRHSRVLGKQWMTSKFDLDLLSGGLGLTDNPVARLVDTAPVGGQVQMRQS